MENSMSNATITTETTVKATVKATSPDGITEVIGNEAKGLYRNSGLAFKSGMNVQEFARHNSLSIEKAEGLYKPFRAMCWAAMAEAATVNQKIVSVRHGAKWDRSAKRWIATTTTRHEGGAASHELASKAFARSKAQLEETIGFQLSALSDCIQ